jgi:transcription termination factor Rho
VSDTDTISTEQPAGPAGAAAASNDAEAAPSDGGAANGVPARRRGLTGMVLAELRTLAAELHIPDTAGMRKSELIGAIKERQAGGARRAGYSAQGQLSLAGDAEEKASTIPAPSETSVSSQGAADAAPDQSTRRRRTASRPAGAPEPTVESAEVTAAVEAPQRPRENSVDTAPEKDSGPERDSGIARTGGETGGEARRDSAEPRRRERRGEDGGNRENNRDGGNNRQQDNRDGGNRGNRDGGNNRQQDSRDNGSNSRDDDDDEMGGRRRGRRFRDRNRRGRDRREGGGSGNSGSGGGNVEQPEVRDDDVLLPVAGILDVLDNYAFVRTSGYLSGPNDVYVSLSMVRRYGLRRGDNVSGVVRQPREGEQQRQKFNPLVRVDSVNNQDPELARNRAEFTKLTPLYPNERLRLETESTKLTTRVIDLVMPVGKGQRALIVSPPKAGKTMILQAIANAITTNNPECHLMVVLVDERPEEVTDMQRSVKGEVIASTFDRPPADHTTVAELSIERAKRLVEMGHDVVVLLDSITRLGRAYNLAAPASGRILSGGVDSTALYPPKRFLGAARNIEDGGSLTIFATALVETGSTMDTVIFEEFKGTGNAELKLDRRIADKRIFPAIDVDASGTRKEELLLAPDEMAVTVKLRRVLSSLDDQQALDLVLTQLRKTRTNIEFLMQVAKNTPNVDD